MTTFVRDRKDAEFAINRVGGVPLVIKLLQGTHGIGVMLARDHTTALAILESFHSVRQNILLQQFVTESSGKDLRAIVVGDRVVAGMRRVAKGDEFRSNLHRGAQATPVDVTPEQERAAVRASQIMGLEVSGVDMLESDRGPLVLEVNSSPGFGGY